MTSILAGRYELGPALRETSLGAVHSGLDTQLGRRVAVTVLSGEAARDAATVGLFAATVSVAAELAHPNIARVYDAGIDEANGRRWAIGEWIEVPSAAEYEVAPGTSAEEWANTVLALADQLADAMQYAQSNGVIHGGLSPETVRLKLADGSAPTVRVSSFGPQPADLAVLSDPELTVRMWQRFTAELSNPASEQLAGMAPTRRTDIYGFGVVLDALLQKRPGGQTAAAAASPAAASPDAAGADAAGADAASPDVRGSRHAHPSEAVAAGVNVDLADELGRIAAQALSPKPTDRQHSFLVVQEQLRWVRVARELDRTEPAPHEETPTLVMPGLTDAYPKTEEIRILLTRPMAQPARQRPLRRQKSRGGILFAVLAAAVLAGGGVAWASANAATTPQAAASITVPLVAGGDVATATGTLGKLGLVIGGQRAQPDPSIAPGLVTGTDPAAGSQLPLSGVVTLLVSAGPDLAAVPQLEGLGVDAAQDALKSAGLVAGSISRRDGTSPAGMVLDSDPAFGASVGAGSSVSLVVSSGNQTVPKGLVGQAGQAAADALAAAGFAPQIRKQESSEVADGVVISVDPGAGTSLPLGSIVTIVQSIYVAPRPTPSAPTPKPTNTVRPSTTAHPSNAAQGQGDDD